MFRKKEEKLDSVIGANCSFEGQIDIKGAIRIDGTIKGNVAADWIILGEHAKVQGDLSGKNIIVGGVVTGNIFAKENLEIRRTGKVYGEIRSCKLTIIEGGIFEGSSSSYNQESVVVDIQSKEKDTYSKVE